MPQWNRGIKALYNKIVENNEFSFESVGFSVGVCVCMTQPLCFDQQKHGGFCLVYTTTTSNVR